MPSTPNSTLIYLHGFLSSPLSHKAQSVQQWLAQHAPQVQYCCPELSPYPEQAASTLQQLMSTLTTGQPVGVVGSSLGGYWATWLAEQYGIPAVVINPSVYPYNMMPHYLHQSLRAYYSDEQYYLREEHVAAIKSYDTPQLTRPERYWLLAQTGDETLDYREACAKYRHTRQTIEVGGDHSFQGFVRFMPELLRFLFIHNCSDL